MDTRCLLNVLDLRLVDLFPTIRAVLGAGHDSPGRREIIGDTRRCWSPDDGRKRRASSITITITIGEQPQIAQILGIYRRVGNVGWVGGGLLDHRMQFARWLRCRFLSAAL